MKGVGGNTLRACSCLCLCRQIVACLRQPPDGSALLSGVRAHRPHPHFISEYLEIKTLAVQKCAVCSAGAYVSRVIPCGSPPGQLPV